MIVTVCHASGTFIMPPPPVKKVVLDPELLQMGTQFVVRTSANGKFCLSCHGKDKPQEFKRRSLGSIFPQLTQKVNLCWTDGTRMGEQGFIESDTRIMQSIRTWLAKEYRLEEQLARGEK